jgi:hypothetical protein
MGDSKTRLQELIAEGARQALLRSGADHEAVARVEELLQPKTRPPPPRPEPLVPRAPRRMRPAARTVVGLDMGDRFRLSEPPDLGESHGPRAFNANWLAVAALAFAALYYLVR